MSLGDLTRDKQFPFSRFAEDEGDYRKSQVFWDDAFKDALGDNRSGWVDWMQDPFRDGHPMLSKIHRGKHLGVLLQQVNRSADRFWFKCWMSSVEDREAGRDIPYLFVETVISEPGRTRFQELIEAWCVRGSDDAHMRRLTDAIRIQASEEYRTADFGWKD